MRWDPERTVRSNQDHQREREEIAIRDLVRHLAKRNQQQQHQPQPQQPQPQTAFPPRLGVNFTNILGAAFSYMKVFCATFMYLQFGFEFFLSI